MPTCASPTKQGINEYKFIGLYAARARIEVGNWADSLMIIGLLYIEPDVAVAAVIAGFSILTARLLAIYFHVSLFSDRL